MTPATADRPPIVVTGGSGFVGCRLLAALAERGGRQLVCFDREPERLRRRGDWPSTWHAERIDIADPASAAAMASTMPRGAVVVHLAAATGNVAPSAMRSTNVEGTRRVVAAARESGASHLVFASSIAAGFRNRRWYHYAESKREGERIVSGSGVPFSIVRPTMVFGRGSPIEEALTRLAVGGAPIVLGSGAVKTQPVHVDDVVVMLVALVDSSPAGAVLEVGGADRLDMRELMGRIRVGHGLPPRSVIGIPLGIPRLVLGTVEPVLRRVLPVTAGQLAAFVNDSDAAPSERVAALMPAPRGILDMLSRDAGRD